MGRHTSAVGVKADQWSRWLLERRHGGDQQQLAIVLDHLAEVRERVLQAGEPLDGSTLLDVGTGDGLIGLGALERVGSEGSVIFSDVSEALLEQCRQAVSSQGALARARFIAAPAEDLAGIPDTSVDVVTTRSVLIYVEHKAKAFEEFHRVLRPGGRLSLFEPINRLMFPEPEERFWGYDVRGVVDLAARVKAKFDELEDTAFCSAMMGFDDRDLARLAERAGFEPVHVECHIDIEPGSIMRPVSLDALLDGAPNPNAPTLREAIAAALTEPEQERFLAVLEHAFEQYNAVRRMAVAYLAAAKAY